MLIFVKKHPHVVVFVFFLLLHIFIFRNLILHIPAMVRGDEVIAREELIPFFNFKTQFFDQLLGGVSPLTQTTEIRISYSSLTAWVRYYVFLPFAVFILPALSAYLLYVSFYIAAKAIIKIEEKSHLIPGALLTGTFLHLILLQAKLTHFYELLFGFSLFAVALSLLIELFIEGESFRWKKILLLSIVVLCNPGIHYHFLFLFIFALLFLYFLVINRKNKQYIRSVLASSILMILGSTIPYALLILHVVTRSGGISDSIPLGYSTILYQSVRIPQLLTLGIASQYDMFTQGKYLVVTPRLFNLGFIFITLFNFLGFRIWNKQRVLSIGAILLVAGLSFWFSLGYLYAGSAHNFLAFLVRSSSHVYLVGDLIERIVSNFLQVLRFPHRFQFPYFYSIGVLATVGMYMGLKFFRRFYIPYLVALSIICSVPFFVEAAYKIPFLSGDFGGFLKPYPISDDLVQIKSILQARPGLSIILPTFESGRVVEGTQFNFIDKFLIYYIDAPFLYYGAGANTTNKFKVFEAYEAMIEGGRWWDKYLKSVLSIDYIIVPHADTRLKGQVYLPKIDDAIQRQLATSAAYQVTLKGSQYDLYERKDRSIVSDENKRALLLNMSHAQLGKAVSGGAFLSTKIYLPLESKEFIQDTKAASKQIYTNRPEVVYFDLIDQVSTKIKRYFPDDSMAPFDSSFVQSTDYSTTPLALSTLLVSKKNANYPVVKDLINMTKPKFLITNGAPIAFKKVHIRTGETRFLVKAATKDTELIATVNDQNIFSLKRLENISEDTEFVYYVGSFTSIKDQDVDILVQNANLRSPLALESLLAVPKASYIAPLDGKQIGSALLRFTPLTTPNLYLITTSCGSAKVCE